MTEKANGRRRPKGLATDLYTTEGCESRKQSLSEQLEPDPTQEEGERAIAKNTKHSTEEEEEDVE